MDNTYCTDNKLRDELNKLTHKIIGVAMKVHNNLGPGFIEKIYERAMEYEFRLNGISFTQQKEIKVYYGDIDLGFQRIDFLIDDAVVVELKSVSQLNEIHIAQMLLYLKAANKRIGLIFNFSNTALKIKRIVNKL